MAPNYDKIEKSKDNNERLPLADFFEQQVLPHLRESDQAFYQDLIAVAEDGSPDKDHLRSDYEEFLNYDPTSDDGDQFYILVIALSQFAVAEKFIQFPDAKEVFIEKVTAFANALYSKAFFRNSYDSYAAWKDCCRFKEYQKLFYSLDVLPKGAKDRIDSISAELDSIWSRPDVEMEIRNGRADELIGTFSKEGDLVDKILREESTPLTEDEFKKLQITRPDLLPSSYEDYVKELAEYIHPFILKL